MSRALVRSLADAKRLKLPALPPGIELADLVPPAWDAPDPPVKDWESRQFDLWYTERFGWCIPTLLISHSRRAPDRTYAHSLKTNGPVRIGNGPHVLHQLEVHVRQSRAKALRPYLDARLSGQATAGDIRDRISTRRALGALRRRDFGGGF